MSDIQGFPSPSHSHDISATSEISTSINYGVNGRIPFGDFEEQVKVLVREFVKSKWSISSPAVSTNPPTDFVDHLRFGDHDYDSYSTYYIKVSEGPTGFDNSLVSQGMLGFITPVLFKLTARRLTHNENFSQLENMKRELIRIIGRYELHEISGISTMSIMEPSDEPQQLPGQRSLYEDSVTALAFYNKNYF
jgi:hypothetical protein